MTKFDTIPPPPLFLLSGLDERPFKRDLVIYLFLSYFFLQRCNQSRPSCWKYKVASHWYIYTPSAESLQKDAVVRPWWPFRLDGHTYIIISACCWLAACCRLNWLLPLNHGRVKRRLIVNVLLYTTQTTLSSVCVYLSATGVRLEMEKWRSSFLSLELLHCCCWPKKSFSIAIFALRSFSLCLYALNWLWHTQSTSPFY